MALLGEVGHRVDQEVSVWSECLAVCRETRLNQNQVFEAVGLGLVGSTVLGFDRITTALVSDVILCH